MTSNFPKIALREMEELIRIYLNSEQALQLKRVKKDVNLTLHVIALRSKLQMGVVGYVKVVILTIVMIKLTFKSSLEPEVTSNQQFIG